MKGVTGSAALDVDAVAARIPAIRARTGLPVGVGFGIRDAETARAQLPPSPTRSSSAAASSRNRTIDAGNRLYDRQALVSGIRRGIDAA